MYVRPYTTEEEIRKEIERIEQELRTVRTPEEREAMFIELDYLNSFLPQDRF